MSDTPRADSVWDAAGRGPVDGPEKWMDAMCRNLERELATALLISEERRVRALKTAAKVDKLKEIAEGLAYTRCPIHRGYWKSNLREPLTIPLR